MRRFIHLGALCAITGCSTLHNAAIGERLEVRPTQRIETAKSAVGINKEGLNKFGNSLIPNSSPAGRSLESWSGFFVAATSFSPRTGSPTEHDRWADGIDQQLRAQCPEGMISGIMTTRETANYGLLTGEMVRVRALCTGKK